MIKNKKRKDISPTPPLDWEVVIKLRATSGGTVKVLPESNGIDSPVSTFQSAVCMVSSIYYTYPVETLPTLYIRRTSSKDNLYGWDTSSLGERIYYGGCTGIRPH